MANINDTYFDGYYKDIWRSIIPEELTEKEVDFMLSYFNLHPGSKVLDLMCGYGRHAIALAKKGIPVTAVDILDEYIDEIKNTVEIEQLPLKVIKGDVLEYKIDEAVDLAICMGNSLNFFNAHDTARLLTEISSQLKPGGHLFINSWSITEIVFRNFKDKSWSSVGDLKFLADSKIHFHPTRIEVESIIISPDGKTEIKTGIDYIFSINEMESMLSDAGLRLTAVYSIPGRKKFTFGEPRAYLVAERV